MRLSICISTFALLCLAAMAQTSVKKIEPPRSEQQAQSRTGESSSKDSKIDLAPPKSDDIKHPDSDDDSNSEVIEAKPWNPHKAAKDIEVGDYYAKRKNYKAAISRYREALEYKPKDAEATFRLAQVLEATKANDEALRRYLEYLKILPGGEFAAEAKAGAERLKGKSGTS